MELVNLSEKFLAIKTAMAKAEFTDVSLPQNFKSEYEKYIANNKANGYSEVEWAEFSTKIITSTGKSIFLTNYWFYIALELAGYLEGLNKQKELFENIFKGEVLNEVATTLRKEISNDNETRIKRYLETNGFSHQDYDYFSSFISDYDSWGGGKTIDRGDFYVSPLLKAGNLLAETQGAVAELAKQFSEEVTLRNLFHPEFVTKKVKEADSHKTSHILEESSRSQFVFSLISFLIKEKKQTPLFECLIEKSSEHGNYNLEYEAHRLTTFFKISDKEIEIQGLTSGEKIRFFKEPFLVGSQYHYLSNQWTDGTSSRLDIQTLCSIFNSIYTEYQILSLDGLYVLTSAKKVAELGLSKPFLLLAGISGTGKTRFVKKQAECRGEVTYCLTSVRPDWHEPSDLLGYVSRLSGQAEYVVTDVLAFIVKAWLEIEKFGITLNGNLATGNQDQQQQVRTFWLCLDEMNLAPVEQYFADYLSVLETREWLWENNEFEYKCEPLLKPSLFDSIDQDKLKKTLGLADHDDLWQHFVTNGISIPFNLIVAGTVNMDETTHGFSRKVIDRALTFDFGEFFPNDLDEFFKPTKEPKVLSYPVWSDGRNTVELNDTFDSEGSLSIELLKSINAILINTPFKLAYRALNELLLSVMTNKPTTEIELQAVWDDFLMCKVLPRIEGDIDKLTKGGENTHIIEQLNVVLSKQLNNIWDGKIRPDLYRKYLDKEEAIDIECRSKAKLKWMSGQLDNGFTSFWP
ncbi:MULTISPECIES: McrB family protein [unclassified Pseudoalteromonas]|uniref:McrB family protein n=1 Tax=unclassified Pseudoalteromonas TaxID=194690 RepID=UPI0005A75DF4|nr:MULTISPECIES: hypothetical protein [unclassified Pseudoalteromonas]